MIVHKQQAGRGIACDEDVGPSVFVKVGGDHRHSVALGCSGNASLFRHVGERAIAVVAIKGMPPGRKPARAAIHRNAFPIAGRVLAGRGGMFERKSDVVGNEEVEMPVAVVVQECAASAPSCRTRLQKSGCFGDIGERAITIVAVQAVLSEVGAEDVVEAVVVVVGNADSIRPAG